MMRSTSTTMEFQDAWANEGANRDGTVIKPLKLSVGRRRPVAAERQSVRQTGR